MKLDNGHTIVALENCLSQKMPASLLQHRHQRHLEAAKSIRCSTAAQWCPHLDKARVEACPQFCGNLGHLLHGFSSQLDSLWDRAPSLDTHFDIPIMVVHFHLACNRP